MVRVNIYDSLEALQTLKSLYSFNPSWKGRFFIFIFLIPNCQRLHNVNACEGFKNHLHILASLVHVHVYLNGESVLRSCVVTRVSLVSGSSFLTCSVYRFLVH